MSRLVGVRFSDCHSTQQRARDLPSKRVQQGVVRRACQVHAFAKRRAGRAKRMGATSAWYASRKPAFSTGVMEESSRPWLSNSFSSSFNFWNNFIFRILKNTLAMQKCILKVNLKS